MTYFDLLTLDGLSQEIAARLGKVLDEEFKDAKAEDKTKALGALIAAIDLIESKKEIRKEVTYGY